MQAAQLSPLQWLIRNTTLHRDLKFNMVFDEINRHSSRYHARHRNRLAKSLTGSRPNFLCGTRKSTTLQVVVAVAVVHVVVVAAALSS